MLIYCKNNKKTISKKISWITEYKNFILEISAINKVICDIEKILKNKGSSEETHKACNKLLKDITSSLGVKLKTQSFFKYCLSYMDNISYADRQYFFI